MVWQKAALPVSRHIVLKLSTRSMPQSKAGYNNAISAACGAVIHVSIELPIWRSSNLWNGRSALLSLKLAACNIVGDTRAVHLVHVNCADLKSKARVWIR